MIKILHSADWHLDSPLSGHTPQQAQLLKRELKKIPEKIVKLCKDTVGEMKKVVWLPKAELAKSTKLVVVTVVAIAAAIAVIDTAFSFLINGIAGLIG